MIPAIIITLSLVSLAGCLAGVWIAVTETLSKH